MSHTLNFVLASPNEAADKIDGMEKRVEALEAALRAILAVPASPTVDADIDDIARNALDQSSPPSATE